MSNFLQKLQLLDIGNNLNALLKTGNMKKNQ